MDITFYTIENDAFVKTSPDIKAENWKDTIDWVDIRIHDRKQVTDIFQKWNLKSEVLDFIEHPEENHFSNSFEGIIVLNLSISNATNIYKTDYLSVILEEKLVMTIIPQQSNLFNSRNLSTYTGKKYPSVSNFLFYILTVKILAQSNVNMSTARTRLQGIEKLLITDPEELSSGDLMSCERDIDELSDIIEDQYVGFGIVASLSTENLREEAVQQLRNAIKGFQPLDKAMQRLEKKAESLRLQFMLIQQEKSTRKINVLTIVQAIFVPLTFIAGVYGMNFIVMPELNWQYGYLFVWLIFIGMASGLLIYFYRKGWFD